MGTDHDILITGPLVDCDLIMAEHLARRGLKPLVVRKPDTRFDTPRDYFTSFDPDDAQIVADPFRFLSIAKRSPLILSITGSLITHLGKLWPLRHLLSLPPIINLTTGSDITERAVEPSAAGRRYRQYLKLADLNWCLPLPHALQNLSRLRVPNVVFMNGFPYISKVSEPRLERPRTPGSLKMFHCSNFDWNYTDFGTHRNSTKGNDRFLRAFIRAVQNGYDVRATMLYRGPDREVAREMIRRGGAEDRVVWRDSLSRDELFEEMDACDVVVNMFSHGGVGCIGYEAMGMGKPLMQYVNPTFFNLMYGGSMPPVISARHEDEIYDRIVECCAGQHLDEAARRGPDWVRRHIAPESSLDTFLFHYGRLTGRPALAFGAHIEAMEAHVHSVSRGAYDPYVDLG